MNARPIGQTLFATLQSLAECQLQIQASRSAGLDAGAVGLMGVDAAVAASVLGVRSAFDLWAIALALLLGSIAILTSALLMTGAEDIGPPVESIIADRPNWAEDEVEDRVLNDVAGRVSTNQDALARKEPRVMSALGATLLAIAVEIAGQIH